MTNDGDIRFGTFLPACSDRARPEAFERIAITAEAAGFDWIGRGDHIAFPDWPDAPDGRSPSTPAFDVFSVLSSVAALTNRIRLGTRITVVPYRHPVQLAKLALTLDNLSAGRFELGVGAGWHEREFDLLDVPFPERGSRTDEFLRLFQRVQTDDIVEFEGQHHEFGPTGFYPRPVQDRIPIVVGGRSAPAFRRVAAFGDGWGYTDSPDGIRDATTHLARAWRAFDRSGEPDILVGQAAHLGGSSPRGPEGPLIGDTDRVIAGIDEFVTAGATRIDLKFGDTTADLDDHLAQIECFGEQIIPSFR